MIRNRVSRKTAGYWRVRRSVRKAARQARGRLAILAALALAAGVTGVSTQVTAASAARQGTPRSSGTPAHARLLAAAAPAASTPSPCPPVSGQPAGGSPKIMVVGDSISQGSSGDYTWRYRLYEHLVSDGLSPQMVGPYNWLFNNVTSAQGDCSYADPVFENAHDAVWGQMLATAMTTIQDQVATYQPDYLLVLIGINDLAFGTSDVAGTEANLKTFLANAQAANPNIKIVLGDLLPKASEPANLTAEVAQYNADLPGIAAAASTPASTVVVADDASSVDPAADLWDGTHPNAEGEIKIAAGFADALATSYGLGSQYPTPLPTVPTGPLVAPQLTAIAGDGQAQLSWTLPPGADGFVVYQKDVTAGDTTFTKLPYPLPASYDPWTAADLVNGATYQYKLQACKGVDCNTTSNTVTVTPTGPAPDAPTGLTATAGDGQATLSWTAAANATGYFVLQEDVSAGETSFTKLPYPVSGTSWTAGDLENGATYKYELQSVNGTIPGGTTAPVSVTPTGPVPAAPTGVTATAGDGQAVLSWTPAANATGYYVLMKNVTNGDTSFTQLPYQVAGSSWTAGGLVNGTQYQFELKSVNGLITGATSAAVSVTPTAAPPSAPAGLTATAGRHQAVLSWTPAAGATGYYVLVKDVTAGDTTFTQLPYPVSGSSWTDRGLTDGATYQFKLQSLDGLINGGTTSAVSVTPTGPAPGTPTGFSADPADGQAVLRWTLPADADCVVIFQDTGSGFSQLPYPVCGDSFTAGGLVNGKTYQYKVQAYDDLIAGGTTTAVSVTPAGPAPAGPENLTVHGGNGDAVLEWNEASHATSYYIWQNGVRLTYPVTGNTWTARDLVNGETYTYQVQSLDGLQPGGKSNPVSVTPLGPTPAGPSDLTASNVSWQGTAVLDWTNTSSASAYVVYQSVNGGTYTALQYPLTSGPWTAGALVPGKTYAYKLLAVNGQQTGTYSNPVSFTVPKPPAPSGLTVTASAAKPYSAQLSWNPVHGADGYYIYYGVGSSGSSQPALSQLPYMVTDDHFNAGDLISQGWQWFAVTAAKSGVQGAQSTAASTEAYMENVDYYTAQQEYLTNADAGDRFYDSMLTNVGSAGASDNIYLVRAFIQPDDVTSDPIDDRPGFSANVTAVSRAVVAWDPASGALGVVVSPSCPLGAFCRTALPLKQVSSQPIPVKPECGSPLDCLNIGGSGPFTNNLISIGGGGKAVQVYYQLANSYSTFPEGGLISPGAIDGQMTLDYQGAHTGAEVDLNTDQFPSWEYLVVPKYTPNGQPGGIDGTQLLGTRTQGPSLYYLCSACYGQIDFGWSP